MNPTCTDCVFNELCHGGKSTWGEKCGTSDEGLPISTIHTCGTCGKRKLTIWDESDGGEVPEDCPRWHPRQGSSLDCVDCLDERRAIKGAHPMADRRHEAAKKLLQGLFTGKKAEEDAIGGFVEALMPGHVIKASDHYEPALSLMSYIYAEVSERFGNPMSVYDKERIEGFKVEWMEYIFLSMQRNPTDPARVTWEIVLMVTDKSVVSREWSQKTPPERVKIQMAWEIRVRRVMGIEEPVRC